MHRAQRWALGASIGLTTLLVLVAGLVFRRGLRGIRAASAERETLYRTVAESEARLAEAQALAHLGNWEWDVKSGVNTWSDENFRIHGFAPGSVQPSYDVWIGRIHPEDRERVLSAVQAALDGRAPYDVECRVVHPDGAIRYVRNTGSVARDPTGAAKRMVGTVLDVTAFRRVEQALGEQDMRFQSLISHSNDIIVLLGPSGTLMYVSPSLDRILGYPPGTWLNRPVLDLVWPDDVQIARELLSRGEASPRVELPFQLRVRHADGGLRWLEGSGTNYFDDPGIGGVVVNARDTTERRRLEVQFLQAQKMESVGQLAGGVAHDFNNLLTVISGQASLALMRVQRDDPTRQSLLEIEKAAESAAGVTRQLLAFSRKQLINPTVLTPALAVADMESMLARLIGETIAVTVERAADPWTVRMDQGQIEQVVMNLAVNARDAMPDGGRLTIRVGNAVLGPDYVRLHPQAVAGEYVVISVVDTGIGMKPELIERIFLPFFTTKPVGRGTGLGLASVHGIVSQNGGHVDVESHVGVGTTFHVYLPRAAGPAAPQKPPALPNLPTGTETLVVVEDEEALRVLAASLLGRLGYTVLTFGSGAEALAGVSTSPRPIHLLLTDVVLGGMSGRVLAERLREIRPELKVLFMSGYTEDVVLRHGVLAGEMAFVAKPFSMETLAKRVREVLDSARV